MKNNDLASKSKSFIFLHCVLLLYSLCSVCSKNAALFDFFSLQWIFWYGLSLCGLFVYAVLWQQVIKRMPLTIAFSNKAVVIIWGIIWSILVFQESLKPSMLIGAAIIIIGVYIVGTCNE
jgi:drug/metabolite transporter (DMT)-like permease